MDFHGPISFGVGTITSPFIRQPWRTSVDAHQDDLVNPFSMDSECTNCGRCESREQVVHGYGDVGADFLFVATGPTAGTDETGIPFTGDEPGRKLQSILGELGFSRSPPDAAEPDLQNVFLTYLTRCWGRTPPAADEMAACEPFLNAEIRMINPEIIVPIGQAALDALAIEYTTRRPDSFDVEAEHATTIRGRGFELIPMVSLGEQTPAQRDAFLDHVSENVFGRDYRQTKGRRSR